MKKRLCKLLPLLLVLGAALLVSAGAALDGDGTQANPYKITKESLSDVAKYFTAHESNPPAETVYFQLAEDVALDSEASLKFPAGFTLELDFNGHTLTKNKDSNNGPIENAAELTLRDSSESSAGGIYGNNRCVGNTGSMWIYGGIYETSNDNHGTALLNDDAASKMTIYDCTVDAAYYGVYNSGTMTVYGGDFRSTSCIFLSRPEPASFCFVSEGTLDFRGGSVTGVHGAIAIIGGKAYVYDGNFQTVVCSQCKEPPYSNQAIYIAGELAGKDVEAHIYGGTFHSAASNAIWCDEYKAAVTAYISGGTFIGAEGYEAARFTGTIISLISGGAFSTPVDNQYCAEGFHTGTQQADGMYSVIPEFFSGGTGTAAEPFVISTAEQLKGFAESVNGGEDYAGKYIELDSETAAFDLSSIALWPMIGQGNDTTKVYHPFSGHFNGNNIPITGLHIGGAADNSYVGFFGYLTGAEVENVVIQDAAVVCNQDNWVGVLAGRANGSTIRGCTVSGTVTVSSSSPAATKGIAAAGLVEYLQNTAVENCQTDVDITVSSDANMVYVGGIACEVNGSTITECTNAGDLSGFSTGYYSYVGGIAAYIKNSSTVADCVNTGAVSSGSDDAVYATAGGILGQVWHENDSTTEQVSGCRNEGSVTAQALNDASYAGGIVGETYQYDPDTWAAETRSDIAITGCTNTGAVNAAGGAGGILAWGDMEWKLNLSGNTYTGEETGWFNAPAEFTLGDDTAQYKYSEYGAHFYIFQTLHLEGNLNIAQLTVAEGQTLILEDGVTVNKVTVQPGGQLVVEEGATVTGTVSTGTGYMITFQDGNEVLFQMATEANGAVILPEAPVKSGYTFAGWFTADGQQIRTGSLVTADTTVTARWSAVSSGSSSSSSTSTKTPSQQAADKIKAAKDGATVEITLKSGQTKLDKEVFEELAGRDVTLQISLPGGVMWTVNGEDIPADADLTDLDLGVTMDTDGIPASVFNAITGETGTVQLTLAHDGEFGFALTLTAPLGKDYADLWANLYHYDEDAGKLVFQTAARIGADGTADLRFTHASEYAIVIDDRDHTPKAFPFADVRETDWFYDAVDFVYQNELMNGTSGTTFAPDGTMTRAMLVTILHRQAGEPVVNYAMPFDDVTEGTWYSEAVRWAASEGIVTGTGATTFAPDAPVTREQFAAILYRYAQQSDTDVSVGEDTNILSYADALEISEYAVPAMQWACGAGVIEGSGANLNPQDSATRAEAATMLMRFVQTIG